jgi:GMP synthase (glutamine-hydrolysing)
MKIPWFNNSQYGLNKQSASITKGNQRQKMNGQKVLKQIALIKTGGTIDEIRARYGDFEDWFARGTGISDLLQIDVFRHQPLPDPQNLRAIIITGSSAMVSTREDWSERTAKWLKMAVLSDIPVLGVCYGHQLLAHALGGRSGPNPAGRQIGTVKAQLTEEATKDPLLGYLGHSFMVQSSHSEAVLELPPGAQRLATSPLDDNFSIRFAEKAWGVQFHPEFSGVVMSEYIRLRAQALREEGLDPETLMEKSADTDQASLVLSRFIELLD